MSERSEWIALPLAHKAAAVFFASEKTAELMLYNAFREKKLKARGMYYLGDKHYPETHLSADRGVKREFIIWNEGRIEFKITKIGQFSDPPDYTHFGDFHRVEFSRSDLISLWPGILPEMDVVREGEASAKPVATKALRAGRAPTHDWAAAAGALAGHLYNNGMQSNAELTRVVQRWFADERGRAPDERDIQKFVSEALQEFERQVARG
ncbi:hypothetical protein [Methylobacterium sp. Leaf361]|uniref:hypothetical protein n=1 Tax=Methylobacterium sp. Leaf361 TaxID=1736352 RepID=UPI0012FEEFC8|nr:hypothetical protein [Methylobacterium sp. Leaf361]